MEVSTPTTSPSCTGNEDLGIIHLPMLHLSVLVIVLLILTIFLCLLSSVLSFALCIIWHKKLSRTSDLQDQPTTNGYIVPIQKDEKELLQSQEDTTTNTFRPELNTAITREDVQRDIIIHQNTLIDCLSTIANKEADIQLSTHKTEVDVDNPLYVETNSHHSLEKSSSVSPTPLKPVTTDDLVTDVFGTCSKDDYENGSEYDYENMSTVRLAKSTACQEAYSPPPTSAVVATSIDYLPKQSKQPPPEIKPKPTSKQRSKSISSCKVQDNVQIEDSEQEENHYYMSPKSAGLIPWRPYKELDFSTVEPTSDYATPFQQFTEY